MDKFGVCVDNKICMDVGASTGGFTDCMLQNGADKGYILWMWDMDSLHGN